MEYDDETEACAIAHKALRDETLVFDFEIRRKWKEGEAEHKVHLPKFKEGYEHWEEGYMSIIKEKLLERHKVEMSYEKNENGYECTLRRQRK